jgi:hypothetical protein
VSTTTAEDRERFFGQSATNRVHVIESEWFERMQGCRLYFYRLPVEPFRPHDVGGYWVADEEIEATERVVVSDLLGLHVRARIELRLTPSIWPFWRLVIDSTLEFSGHRLRNSAPHADPDDSATTRPTRPTRTSSRPDSVTSDGWTRNP